MEVSATPKHDHFHPFPKFPFEIREMIWLAAAAQCKSRIIKISTSTTTETHTDENGELRRDLHIRPKVCSYKVPSLLHTNREARETVTITEKRYLLCFEKELNGKPVYINLNKDCVFFEDDYAFLAFYDLEPLEENESFMERLPCTPTILERSIRAIGIGVDLSRTWSIFLPRFHRLQYVYFLRDMRCQGFDTPLDTMSTTYNMIRELFQDAAKKRGSGCARVPEIVELWPEVFSKLFTGEVFWSVFFVKDAYIMY